MSDAKKALEKAIQEDGPFNGSWLSGISRVNARSIDAAWKADRALAEADKAATERERERCFKLHIGLRQTDKRGFVRGDMITHNGAIADYAMAIRGAGHE